MEIQYIEKMSCIKFEVILMPRPQAKPASHNAHVQMLLFMNPEFSLRRIASNLFRNLVAVLLLSLITVFSALTAGTQVLPADTSNPRPQFVLLGLSAHPDDEDGATLTYYSRLENINTYSVFFTRGEGGQNETGSELYDELGKVRTRETLEAAAILGTKAGFLGFPDFGFSKTAKETFARWGGEDSVLSRLVYTIRTVKPDVIITYHDTVTTGSRRQHGNHQAVGITAYKAFALAADPAYHPEQFHDGIGPWQTKKLFFRERNPPDSLLDSLVNIPVKKEYTPAVKIEDISLWALARHRSQGMEKIMADSLPEFLRRHYYRLIRSAGMYDFDNDDLFSGLNASVRSSYLPPGIAAVNAPPPLTFEEIPKAVDREIPPFPPPASFAFSVTPGYSSLGLVGAKAGMVERPFILHLSNTTGKPLKVEVLATYRGTRIFQHAYAMSDSLHAKIVDAVRLSLDHGELGDEEKIIFIASPSGKGIAALNLLPVRSEITLKPVNAVIPAHAVVGLVRTYDNTLEETMHSLGMRYTLLDSAALASSSLDKFSVIVLDLRFGEYRSDAVKAMPRILEYASNGGNIVAFYNKTGDWNGKSLAPYPLTLTSDRVTEEDASVEMLVPAHPLFTSPNTISAGDWNGWIQERSIYLPSGDTTKTSPVWQRLLGMHDEGEKQPPTSLLWANTGKGSYTYVSLALYRQLRVLNGGAVKLFLNMLAQGRH